MRRVSQGWMPFTSAMPSSRMRSRTRGEAFHCAVSTSSPPTWMYGPGKIAITSVSTSSRNASVGVSRLSTFAYTPQSDGTAVGGCSEAANFG